MPETFDSWQSYFYPETINPVTGLGTLKNLFGERHEDVLRQLEYGRSRRHQEEIRSGKIDIPRTYDAAHLKAIHKAVLGDVFEWAGTYRTVNIVKGTPRGFANVETGEIDRYLNDVHGMVTGTQWSRLNRDEFARDAATVFSYLNQAHPFREGNGRSSKLFLEHVAELSPFRFEFERVTPGQWNEASMLSGPDRFAYEPRPEELHEVFRATVVNRAAGRGYGTGQAK